MKTSTKLPEADRPRANPNDIYPTPAGSEASSATTSTSMPAKPFLKQFLEIFGSFLLGLVGIGLVGFFLGLIVKGPIVSASGYFSEFGNALMLIYFVLPLTAFFGIVAYVKKDILFAAYPLAIFAIGGSLVGTDLVNLISGYLPYLKPERGIDYPRAGLLSASVFMAYYALERPLVHILRAKRQPGLSAGRQQAIYGILLAFMVFILVVVPSGARTLYAAQQRSRAVIRIPNTDQLFGKPATEPFRDSSTFGNISIIYAEATQQKDGVYQEVDSVRITPLKEWWNRDSRAGCGASVRFASIPGQVGTYEYKTTPGNVMYAQTVFTRNRSNPPKDSTAYREHYYCFVLDYQRYLVIRSDSNGSAYLEKYPAEHVIDAIAGAQQYVPECVGQGTGSSNYEFQTPFYCRPQDSKKLQEAIDSSKKRFVTPRPYQPKQFKCTTNNLQRSRQVTYQRVGYFTAAFRRGKRRLLLYQRPGQSFNWLKGVCR